jgi:integral membrane sensor domain MASE1
METVLAILMVLGIFIAIPALIGIAIAGMYMMSSRRGRRAERAEALQMEPAKAPSKAVALGLLGNRAFQWVILAFLCLYYPLIYYLGEIVDHFGWEALHWDFFYTVHDIHRVVFLIPILFAAHCFRIKGAVITTLFAFAVFLPRGLFLSPFPDPTSRMVVFVIFALCFGIYAAILRNQNERLQHLIDASKK